MVQLASHIGFNLLTHNLKQLLPIIELRLNLRILAFTQIEGN